MRNFEKRIIKVQWIPVNIIPLVHECVMTLSGLFHYPGNFFYNLGTSKRFLQLAFKLEFTSNCMILSGMDTKYELIL